MSKVMYVTMGTSLFHSASWEPDVEPARSIPFYREWTERGHTVGSPEARHETFHSHSIKIALRQELRHDNMDDWARALPPELRDEAEPLAGPALRYCAELATLLKLADAEAGAQGPWVFLRSYDRIVLVHDSDTTEGGICRPWVAALHLQRYLEPLLGSGKVGLVPIPGISSLDPARLLGEHSGLNDLAQRIAACPADQVDLVISGGYKIYGIVLSPAVLDGHSGVRLVYLHEESERVLIHPRRPAPPGESGRKELANDVARFTAEMLNDGET